MFVEYDHIFNTQMCIIVVGLDDSLFYLVKTVLIDLAQDSPGVSRRIVALPGSLLQATR